MTAPTITVTLAGGRHLTEFLSFGLKAVRGFDPTMSGRHCLRGPFLRVDGERLPPLNHPTPFALPADTTAVYVHGKSAAGPTDDVHAVLVPAPGEQAVLPLTVATPEKRAEVARVAALLAAATYVVARTMPENPHEYTRREDWASDEDFTFAVRASRRYGHREHYIPPGEVEPAYSETVFPYGSHFVWSFWGDPARTILINRKPLAAPVVPMVVDQQLVAQDARRLPIPPLAPAFAGLAPSLTQCPWFRAGVALFGWPVPDPRPRLRKRHGGKR